MRGFGEDMWHLLSDRLKEDAEKVAEAGFRGLRPIHGAAHAAGVEALFVALEKLDLAEAL